MEKQLLVSKETAEKTFGGKYGVRISVNPGKNWIHEEQLNHLQKNSDGFQHFLKNKKFKLEDGETAVREETSKEKKGRLNLMEQGKNLINKMKGSGKADADAEVDLETFKQSLKSEAESELDLFQNALRNASVEQEKEVLAKLSESLSNESGKVLEQFITLIKKENNAGLEALEKNIAATGTQAFDDTMKKFTADLEKLIDNKINGFKKQLKTAALRSEKG